MELQSLSRKSNSRAPRQESRTVGRDKVRERPAVPEMPVQPETADHRVNHPGAPLGEFFPIQQEGGGILRRRDLWARRRLTTH